MTKTKIIIIVIVLVAVAIGGYFYFARQKESPYDFVTAEVKNIVQEVSATGAVVPAQKIELSFEAGGKIKDVLVEIGDEVKTGEYLVKLDAGDLYIQAQQAEASLDLSKAKRALFLAGATDEEIRVTQTAVDNAQDYLAKLKESTAQDVVSAEAKVTSAEVTLANANQNLADVETEKEFDTDQAYEDALEEANSAYTKADKALLRTFYDVRKTYFTGNDQISLKVREKENTAKDALANAKGYLEIAQTEEIEENIDTALLTLKAALEKIRTALDYIRWALDEPEYRWQVSSTDETNIATEQTNINTAIASITTSQQTITSAKLANQTNINTAKATVFSAQSSLETVRENLTAVKKTAASQLAQAEGQLETAKDQLALKKASPRQVDIALYQAQIEQSKAALALIQKQIADTILKAPIGGIITSVSSKMGEMAKASVSVITMMTQSGLQIEADVSEADIGKVSLADPATITLDAFMDEVWKGKVVDIEPAETIIQGVVYYKVTIGFSQLVKKVKSGMTANVTIITDKRENVLAVPQRAIVEKNDKKYIRILAGESYREQQVETGLMGSEGEIEVISGLKEGDKVITFIKQK